MVCVSSLCGVFFLVGQTLLVALYRQARAHINSVCWKLRSHIRMQPALDKGQVAEDKTFGWLPIHERIAKQAPRGSYLSCYMLW